MEKQIKNWMLQENKNEYLQIGCVDNYNATLLAESASAYFEFENGDDNDALCFEIAIDVIEKWRNESWKRN